MHRAPASTFVCVNKDFCDFGARDMLRELTAARVLLELALLLPLLLALYGVLQAARLLGVIAPAGGGRPHKKKPPRKPARPMLSCYLVDRAALRCRKLVIITPCFLGHLQQARTLLRSLLAAGDTHAVSLRLVVGRAELLEHVRVIACVHGSSSPLCGEPSSTHA